MQGGEKSSNKGMKVINAVEFSVLGQQSWVAFNRHLMGNDKSAVVMVTLPTAVPSIMEL